MLADPPVPVPVLGGAGMGKSTVTLAALHDEAVVKHFGRRRFFVRCDGAESRCALASTIARDSGVAPTADIENAVLSFLDEAPAVLVLDNLESPWEKDTLRVEEFLGLLASCRKLALVVSLRGEQRPGGVPWHEGTRLQPLNAPAAREAFLAIAGQRFKDDPRLDDLCTAVDRVPLAITLLAHQAEGEPTLEELWQRWQQERTAMLQRAGGQDRLTNLELSYEISFQGPRMTDSARRFFSLLVLLPDGICHADLKEAFRERLSDASLLRKVGLAFDDRDRLRVLAPLREYVSRRYPPDEGDRKRLQDHFVTLAGELGDNVGAEGGAEAVQRLAPEAANIEGMLLAAVEGPTPADAIHAATGWAEFVRFTGLGSGGPLEAAAVAAETRGMTQQQANCIQGLGDIALQRSDHDGARERYEAALPLYEKVGDILGQANCIRGLGDIALERWDRDGARTLYQRALELYERIPEPYSIGSAHRSLARVTRNEEESRRHVEAARDSWLSIGRTDLVEALDREFKSGGKE